MPPKDADTPPILANKPNPKNNPTMFKIFQNVQYNVVQHKKYVKEMIKLYKKIDEDSFRESFKNALQYLFTFGDTSANVDRVIQFVATFCTSLDDEEEFLMFICNIIFECQCVSGQSVRYRASQLLAAVLSALGEDASLDDDLCDKLLESQMQRLQDTRGAVRCRAALALQRLQNPMEPDDGVTRAYRFHMSCDPSSSVRRAVVMSIAKCTRNVPYVLERLCDVDEAVRRAAFLYIAGVNVTQLRVRQRVLTLKVGLTERSTRVRRVVEEILIPGWLSTFQGNIVDLLKAIRLDNAHDAKDSQYVAGKLLESLFKRLPISELLEWLPTDKTLRLIPADKLNKETAWYWRHLAEHLQRIEDDETLETVLPDLVVLTGYIRAIVESPCPSETEDPVGFSTRQYVLHELASMLKVYDATDPTGRTSLQSLITDVLTGDYGPLNADVIRAFVSALELVVPEVSPRMEVVSGVISALRDPPEVVEPAAPPPPVDSAEVKMQRARLRVSLNVAIEAQEEAVRDENYSLAAECKAKVADIQKKLEELSVPPPPPPAPIPTIREKVSDAETLNKCLTILNCALDTPQLKTVTPMLQMIFNDLEVEIFQNPEILQNALETVALFGMLDKEFAKENKAFFFANLIDTSNEPIVTTVLKAIVDLLCVHGARVFEDEATDDTQRDESKRKRSTYHSLDATEEDGSISESVISLSPAHSTVIELLLKIMDSTCATYRLIIVEGLCRLLYLGHLESPAIISRLLLLWFNPATVEEDMLRQIIGVFFQTFPANVDGAQEQIQKATIPTLRTLANAPSSSPLAEIDQEAVVRFIVSLTRVNHELTDSQGAMAMSLCAYIVRRPTASCIGLLCRMLALLSPPRSAHVATELAVMLRDACEKLPDKQSCRNLTRYLGALEAMERTSLNKMSNTGITEGTIQGEDTLSQVTGRTTSSLPQPLARSTHVVINETVEEEVEIDETSPSEIVSRVSEENVNPPESTSPRSDKQQSDGDNPVATEPLSDSSSGVSPVKKAKTTKAKKKKLSLTNKSEPTKGKSKGQTSTQATEDDAEKGGIKRSRSQRSLVDVERAQKAKADAAKAKTEAAKTKKASSPESLSSPPFQDLDSSNVTLRRSTRGPASGSSPESSWGKKEKKGKGKGKKKVEGNSSSDALLSPFQDLDTCNVTVRTSTRGRVSESSPDSSGGTKKKKEKSKGKTKVEGNSSSDALLSPFQDLDTSNVTIRRSTRSPRVSLSTLESSAGKEKSKQKKIEGNSSSDSPFRDLDTSNVTIRRSTRETSRLTPKSCQGKKSKHKKIEGNSSPDSPFSSFQDLDTSNVTMRRSTRGLISRLTPKSCGGKKEKLKQKKIEGNSSPDLSFSSFQDLDTSNVTIRRSTRGPTSRLTPKTSGGKKEKLKQKKIEGNSSPDSSFSLFQDLDTSNVTIRRSPRVPTSRLNPKSCGGKKEKLKGNMMEGNSCPATPFSPPFQALDSSNVTIRRSTRGLPTASSSESSGRKKSEKGKGRKKVGEPKPRPVTRSSVGSNRSSAGSHHSMFEDSADETELHTIVYDKEIEQSLLNDSSELMDSKHVSKSNVTIPETPDASDESESEPEPVVTKPKNKRNTKKK